MKVTISLKLYGLLYCIFVFVFVVVCKKMSEKINWEALRSACRNLNLTEIDSIREFNGNGYINVNSADENTVAVSEYDLKTFHHLLFEVHVMDGELICPESGRKFLIKDGIPNMLLHEDELG